MKSSADVDLDADLCLPWHDAAWQRLAVSFANAQIPHALLIHAEGGLHKVHLGRQIAKGLLCAAPVGAMACGECRHCVLVASGNHPDWTQVFPVESAIIKIDQVRDLCARLAMRPQLAARQVALLWPAEQMNVAAANALLKTLEEPAADTHLLLVAHRIGHLPATIRSRCQRLPLHPSLDALSTKAVATMAKVEPARAQTALQYAAGDPELALQTLRSDDWSALLLLIQRLSDLAVGRFDASSFAAAYRNQGGSLLAQWSRLIALAVHGDGLGTEPFAAWISLTSRLEMSTLLPLATQLERARGLAGSGVREDLLVYDLASRWSDAFTSRGRKSGT